MISKKQNNIAFIDGQNLHQGLSWKLDQKQFRIYLRDKYHIQEAYYFVGYRGTDESLYKSLRDAGFIVIFNEKGEMFKSNKKGNIDVTLVFYVMKKYIENAFESVVIVSGDGDFKILVDFLIQEKKFLKILAPNSKYCSSLYNKPSHLSSKFLAYLSPLSDKLEYKRKKGLPKH